MRLPMVFAIAFMGIAAVVVPIVFVAWAERQPWPRRLRLLHAAHYLELASAGVASISVIDATIVEVEAGDRARSLALRTATQAHVRLQLYSTASPSDLSQLRYWRAEAIPVLLIENGCNHVEVWGPSGVVRAEPMLVTRRG
jgi:hypothetical protein